MTLRVRVRLQGTRELQRGLRALSPRRGKWLSDALRKGAFLVAKIAAEEKIERGGNHPPLPDRLTSRTGTLRRSIGVDLAPLPQAAEVGTELIYGLIHEIGAGNYPRRAFLEPAVDDALPRLEGLFATTWTEALP